MVEGPVPFKKMDATFEQDQAAPMEVSKYKLAPVSNVSWDGEVRYICVMKCHGVVNLVC